MSAILLKHCTSAGWGLQGEGFNYLPLPSSGLICGCLSLSAKKLTHYVWNEMGRFVLTQRNLRQSD